MKNIAKYIRWTIYGILATAIIGGIVYFIVSFAVTRFIMRLALCLVLCCFIGFIIDMCYGEYKEAMRKAKESLTKEE